MFRQRVSFASALMAIIGLLAGLAGTAQEWPVERPPRPLEARNVDFPPYEIRKLANGLTVVVVRQHEQPVVSLRLLVRAGAAQDPSDKPGLASLAATLLDQGTTTRSAQQIADSIDYIGGGLSTGAGTDLCFANVIVMKDSLDFAMDLLADVGRNPAFAAEELERQREQILSGLQVSYQDPDYVADLVVERLIFGFHPYGRPGNGTPESIASITREDLAAFHRTWFAPNNALLAIVGDVALEPAFAGAERVFGNWERKEPTASTGGDPPEPTRRVIVIDRPNAVQTEIRVGQLAIQRNHPDFMPLNLAVKILGGEGGNRLQGVLRSERGLTYGAAADMDSYLYAGAIVADTDTRTETTAEALRLMVDEFARLQREAVGQGELSSAQAYLSGNFPLTIETPDAIALQVLNALFYGLDLKELETYRERVNAVRPEDIQRIAKTYFRPARLSVVLVGDASKFAGELKTLGFDRIEQVPLDQLDLTSVDLRRTPRRAAEAAPPNAARSDLLR
jgi:zinc protease